MYKHKILLHIVPWKINFVFIKNRALNLGKKQHIIWDYNGTLLNDRWLCVEVINEMLDKRSKPLISDEIYLRLFDFPVKDYYAKIGFDFAEESFEIVGKEFIDIYDRRQKECLLHKRALQMLRHFHFKGKEQSILSARQLSSLRDEINYLGMSGFFSMIAGLDSFHADGKEAIGHELIKNINITPENILMIGDTVHDWEVAEAIGVDIVLVAHGHHSKERLKECKVMVVGDFAELEQFLT